ncbi:glycosyltransferase [bacterium]|nr:MAG: glycosyltransferase [bacterium]
MMSIGYGLAVSLIIGSASIYASRTLWRRHNFNEENQWWHSLDGWSPWPKLVTVLIAAYNEEDLIGHTLDSILAYSYPFAVEVVVVNDGSTDGTRKVLDSYAAAIKMGPIKIRAFHRPNGGKSAALNFALLNPSIVRGEKTVFIDADTLVRAETIPVLVRPMANPRVGAVSGRVAVQNLGNGWFAKLITRWQQEDYTVGMAVARMAQSMAGVVMVLSGACSACDTAAMRKLGGFATDTMAEDADAGWRLQRAGYQIANAPHAVADTRYPETPRALVKQQFRWYFGILQVIYKHREVLRHLFKNFSQAFIMGYSLINALMPLLAPFIWLLIFGALWQGRWEITLGYYALFTSVRVVTAFVAMYNVREWSWNPLWAVFHRLINDPLQVIVTYRSLFAALSGRLVGWGHVPRQAVFMNP